MDIPPLTEQEKLSLQNIMLRVSLEDQTIQKLQLQISLSKLAQESAKGKLMEWKDSYNIKLKELGLTIDTVDIDAETGAVRRA